MVDLVSTAAYVPPFNLIVLTFGALTFQVSANAAFNLPKPLNGIIAVKAVSGESVSQGAMARTLGIGLHTSVGICPPGVSFVTFPYRPQKGELIFSKNTVKEQVNLVFGQTPVGGIVFLGKIPYNNFIGSRGSAFVNLAGISRPLSIMGGSKGITLNSANPFASRSFYFGVRAGSGIAKTNVKPPYGLKGVRGTVGDGKPFCLPVSHFGGSRGFSGESHGIEKTPSSRSIAAKGSAGNVHSYEVIVARFVGSQIAQRYGWAMVLQQSAPVFGGVRGIIAGDIREKTNIVYPLSGWGLPAIPSGPSNAFTVVVNQGKGSKDLTRFPTLSTSEELSTNDIFLKNGFLIDSAHSIDERYTEKLFTTISVKVSDAYGEKAHQTSMALQTGLIRAYDALKLNTVDGHRIFSRLQSFWQLIRSKSNLESIKFKATEWAENYLIVKIEEGRSASDILQIDIAKGQFPGAGKKVYPVPPIIIPISKRSPVDLVFWQRQPVGTDLIFNFTPSRFIPLNRYYCMSDSASLVLLNNGTPLPATSISISTNTDSWCWVSTLALAHASELDLVSPAAEGPIEVTATINGQSWDFFIEDPEGSRTASNIGVMMDGAEIYGRSLGAYFDNPITTGTWLNNSQFNAQQLAINVLPVNTSLTWTAQDWPVNAGAWSFHGTPVGALLRLAQAAGGFLSCARQGIGFNVAPLYPAAFWDLGTITPWATIPTNYFLSLREKWRVDPDYGTVFISGAIAGKVMASGQSFVGNMLQQIVDPLATHVDMIRQRGIAALSAAGRRVFVTGILPVGEEFGIIPLGVYLQISGTRSYAGFVRSVEINAQVQGNGVTKVLQTIVLETRHV